jgi:hypothetical protein
MFASKAGLTVKLYGTFMTLASNIRQGSKGLPFTNTGLLRKFVNYGHKMGPAIEHSTNNPKIEGSNPSNKERKMAEVGCSEVIAKLLCLVFNS